MRDVPSSSAALAQAEWGRGGETSEVLAIHRLVHVESLLATGRHAEARAALARARLRALAGKIADPAHRERYCEGVPERRRTLALAREWLGDEGA